MHRQLLTSIILAASWQATWAGRPLATDDASTAEPGSCYVESWVEWAGSERNAVLAPACAVAQGIELSAGYALPHPRDDLRAEGALGFKWVPESWRFDTAAGGLALGFKLGASWQQPAGTGWRRSDGGGQMIATLTPSDAWALHANLGALRDRTSGTTAGVLNLAAVWAPTEDGLLFAEAQANSRSSELGGTVRTAGARWWALKDRLGIDLTASRQAGGQQGTLWSFGVGWYEIGF